MKELECLNRSLNIVGTASKFVTKWCETRMKPPKFSFACGGPKADFPLSDIASKNAILFGGTTPMPRLGPEN